MSEDKIVDIYSGMHLEIKHRKLWAIQIIPENLPRIFNMFRDHAMRYDVPHPGEKRDAKFTLSKHIGHNISGGLLDYLVWGPGETLHIVKAEDFQIMYDVTEEIE